jgi:hypothetical protein
MNIQVPALSLSAPLPPVLKQLSVAEPAKKQEEEAEVKAPDADSTILILHTRDISSDEEQLCRKFGTVRHFNPSMVNIDLATVQAQYIFVDVRNKYYRIQIAKVDTDKFRVCALVNSWEKHNNIFDSFVDGINLMTKLPHDVKVAFKEEFDDLLCSQKLIKSPGNSCLSLMSYLINIWDELKRK